MAQHNYSYAFVFNLRLREWMIPKAGKFIFSIIIIYCKTTICFFTEFLIGSGSKYSIEPNTKMWTPNKHAQPTDPYLENAFLLSSLMARQ